MRKRQIKLEIMLLCILFNSICSCSKYDNIHEIENSPLYELAPSLSLESVVYHEATKSYIIPQSDPYTLENFKKAYEKLVKGDSEFPITASQIKELTEYAKLETTHYALKVYPKNETEQWKIELMDGIKVSYIPFNYIQLADETKIDGKPLYTSSGVSIYPEKSHYIEVYDNYETSENIQVDQETIIMPILYVVWPCDKPLPDGIDYIVDYEIFIPTYNDQSKKGTDNQLSIETLQILENEAISLALGISPKTRYQTKSDVVRTYSGRIYQYDHLLETNAPIHNLKIQFRLGSNIWETYSQSNGYFSITNFIPLEASFSYCFHHPKWKITYENSTTPITDVWGTADYWWGDGSQDIYLQPGASYPQFEIHRAVNYFYNGSHSIEKYFYNEGIRIIASSDTNSSANAYFYYSSINNAYIRVYYNNQGNECRIISTVLHELGHFTHFGKKGSHIGSAYEGYIATHKLIRESYASYVGWYLGESYYSTLGWTKSSLTQDITGQSRQLWCKTDDSTAYYSPFFVDLVDDFNQGLYFHGANFESVKHIPYSVIETVAAECTTWLSLKAFLRGYIGIYYTAPEHSSFIQPYEEWF